MTINDALMERISTLDFSMVKRKLQDVECKGWDQNKVDRIETEYRRFLFLIGSEGIEQVPTKEVDDFWHQHILDTRVYAADCQKVFGCFIHHFPYLGMRGEEDKLELTRRFATTNAAYEKVFAKCRGGCEAGRCSPAGCIGSCTSNMNIL